MYNTVDADLSMIIPVYFTSTSDLTPNELVGRTLEGLGAAIRAATDTLRFALPASEETRLDALSTTLTYTGQAVQAGSANWSDAQSAVSSAFTVALDTLGGIGIGVLFGAIASYASTLAPLPAHVRGALVAGVGLFGFAFESALGGTGIYDEIGAGLASAIFRGGQALVDFLTMIVDGLTSNINPITGDQIGFVDLDAYDPSPDPYDIAGADPTWVTSPAFHDPVQLHWRVGSSGGNGETLEPDLKNSSPLQPTLDMTTAGSELLFL